MKSSRIVAGVALIYAAALTAQGPPPGGHGPFGPGQMFGAPFAPLGKAVVTGAPFSAVQDTQMQQTLADGNQIQRSQQAKIYRDSQGAPARKQLGRRTPARTAQRTL